MRGKLMYEWHGFGGGMMWIFWILILIALVWFVVFATRQTGDSQKRENSALEILKERYARGEIDRDEFKQMRDDLNR
jgi:putative membrane protein